MRRRPRGRPPVAVTAQDGPRTLLVASTGGHLSELVELHARLPVLQQAPLWFVPESDQSASLLRGADVVPAPEVPPRRPGALPAATSAAERLLRRYEVDCVVSTGAAVAVGAFAAARAHGIACHYVESAARVEGPSLTGRLVQALPGVHLWTQHAWEVRGRWRRAPSVFDGYRAEQRPGPAPSSLRVLVTVGTVRFGFRRLLEAVRACLPEGATVLWQTGATDVSGLGIDARPSCSAAELAEAARWADVVVAHAGVGSALGALAGGSCPVLVPRRRSHGEHVDDHQTQVAQALVRRGLASAVDPEDLRVEHLHEAARRRAARVIGPLDDLSLERARRW